MYNVTKPPLQYFMLLASHLFCEHNTCTLGKKGRIIAAEQAYVNSEVLHLSGTSGSRHVDTSGQEYESLDGQSRDRESQVKYHVVGTEKCKTVSEKSLYMRHIYCEVESH